MSLKNYFKTKSVQGLVSTADANEDTESIEYIEQYIKDKYKYESILDFSTASNFAVFGSAQEYYDFSIESIQNNYPYDGSAKEKLEWANGANPLDLYIFDKEYPRTNGHVIFNVSNTVSVKSYSGGVVNNHANPTTKEYIYFVGGPNVNNVWDTGSYRGSNLEINGNKGNTIEFWLKKEGFSATNRREVILDVWSSGSLPAEHSYGRLTLELDQQNHAAGTSPFVLTYRSGSTGVHQANLGTSHLAASASDNGWHHYAFTIQNTGSSLSVKTYVDGKLNHSTAVGTSAGSTHRKLVGVIGALATGKAGRGEGTDPNYNAVGKSNLGWGKLSGSLDEFRYWKVMRSEKDIARNFFTQVNGGTNRDESNTKLGVYFKFNEGIARTDSIGKIVLDYAGRLSNGTFVNYTSSNRSVGSAMVQSGRATKEFKDPIVQTDNARLIRFKDSKINAGIERDLFNSSALINSVPAWILDEDSVDGGRGNTRKLLQIIGSYFDILYAQITKVAQLKHVSYSDYDEKPFPFMQQLLSSYGLDVDTMFLDASVLETFADRTENFEFENKLHDVKNMIYKNLYNCLVHINKAKGTEKAIRNILRTHGIDEELVELKTYSDGATYEIRPNYRSSIHKTTAVNFHKTDNQKATIFQYSSSFGLGSKSSEFPQRGYITGSQETISTEGLSFTTEAEVYFPYIFSPVDDEKFISTPTTASIYGAHTIQQTPSGDNLAWTTAVKDLASFNVLAAKESVFSKNVRFQLTSRSGKISTQQSKVFRDVYTGKRWNLAFRLRPSGSAFSNAAFSGSTSNYVAELFGVNVEGGIVQDKFLLTQVLDKEDGEHFHKFSKRIFAGAERNNTVGAVQRKSDVQISYVRHWLNYLDDQTIIQHAIDAKNAGVKDATKRAFSTHPSIDNDILNMDTLALNWSFDTLTGSSAGGNLTILDASSGSVDRVSQFGQLGQILGYNHPGRGFGFPASTTASVITQYYPTYRETGFENIKSSDMIQVLSEDDQTYTKESRPVNYLFVFEKSMYKVISQEMIDMFSTVEEYSNLIGDPVNRYRPNYKAMEKARAKFFAGVENTPSFERFTEFYRWIDTSLSSILDQFMPASAKRQEGIKNIVESHDLERNKYWTKFPTLEKREADPSANILGINELLYDWEHGHAPLDLGGDIPVTSVLDVKSDTDGGISIADDGDVFDLETDGAAVPVSISLWHHIAADQGTGTQYIFGKMHPSDVAQHSYYAYVGSTERISFVYYDTDGDVSAITTGDNVHPLGSWVHIVITIDPELASNQEKIYVNGVLIDQETASAAMDVPRDTAPSLYLGNLRTLMSQPSHGQLSNFVMYKHAADTGALTAEQVKQLYASGRTINYVNDGPRGSDIVGWYKLDGNALDSSGNGRNGSLDTSTTFAAPDSSLSFKRRLTDEQSNCLWQKDRAIRTTDRKVSSEVDSSRETIRRIANTDVSGSTYAIRKLTRPYKLSAGFQHVLHGGDNFHLNKKKDFFKATTNPGSQDFISVTASNINADPCPDVEIPKYRLEGGQVYEKKRYGGEANISDTNRDHDINTVLPFSLYSSSVDSPVGYQKFLFDEFKRGVDITNLHNDAYGDDREIPVQGPFQQQHVGGHFHRHLAMNTGSNLHRRGDRREAFFLSASNGELFVLNPDMEGRTGPERFNLSFSGSYAGRANFMREPLAKRPVNIRNIKTTTGSLLLGNYQHDYQAVLGTSVDVSKNHLVENVNTKYRVDMFLSQSSDLGGYITLDLGLDSEFSSSYFYGYKDRVRPERAARKHVITSRFSAPGGPETAGNAHGGAHLDVATNQYSIYNSMNYRNLNTRLMLDAFSSERQEAFGHRFNSSITSSTPTASFHKVNRNNRYAADFAETREGNPAGGEHDIYIRSDNQFVQHQIPQSDLGYAWIRNSTIDTTGSFRGHQSRFTHPVGLSNETSSAPLFLSASEIGTYQVRDLDPQDVLSDVSPGVWLRNLDGRFSLSTHKIVKSSNHFGDFQPSDFVGLNTMIYEDINTETNKQGNGDIVRTAVRDITSIKPFAFNQARYNYLTSYPGSTFGNVRSVNTSGESTEKGSIVIEGLLTGSQPGGHLLLNAIIANRGASRGYNPWNQLRAGDRPIARLLRKKNVFNFVATKIELPEGTNEDANPFRFRFRTPTPFVDSNYSWPDNITFQKKERSRRVDSLLTQFTESAATSNNMPVRFENFYVKAPDGSLVKPSATTEVKPHVLQTVSVTYDNAFSNFANQNMKDFLKISDLNPPAFLERFAGNSSIVDANRVKVGRTIFPREENVFLQKIRGRENFRNDWALDRSRRNAKSFLLGSQGVKFPSGSLWILDAEDDFGKVDPIALGGPELLARRNEGELLNSAGIYRGGTYGREAPPKPSAIYARKFPETPQIYKMHIKQDAFSYTNLTRYGRPREVSFFIGSPRADAVGRYFITIVPPAHTDTVTQYPNNTLAYIKLSSSATTTRAAIDQIVDGLNSYEGADDFSACPFVFKDVARARADSDKRTVIIEMFQSYQNSALPYDTSFGKQIVGGGKGALDQVNDTFFDTSQDNSTGFVNSLYPKTAQFGIVSTHGNMPSTFDESVSITNRASAGPAFFSASISRNTYLAGAAKYEVGSPWQAVGPNENHGPNSERNYSSYSEWSEQLRKFKDYSVIPEYRISEEMTNYIGVNAEDPFFDCPQEDFLTLTGSNQSFNDSSKNDFYEVLSHSDFVKNFNVTFNQLKKIDSRTSADEISLTCHAVKKLLPYEGFYPSQRITQMAGLFNDSYGPQSQHVGENYKGAETVPNYRNILAPFFAPGIAFNSMKSGIAVDYPLFVPKLDRPFISFATHFEKDSANRVEIGQGKEWAHVLTGSARSAPIGGISVSAWIRPDSLTDNSTDDQTIISFGGIGNNTAGINLSLRPGSGSLEVTFFDNTGRGYRVVDGGGFFGSPTDAPGPIIADDWNFVGFALNGGITDLKTNASASGHCMLHINGVTRTGSFLSETGGGTGQVDCTDLALKGTCQIGNQGTDGTHSFNGAIAEVCIWNKKLEQPDFKGLYGGGLGQRGPWRPDMCVRPQKVDGLVGWYRMGNETGIMSLSSSLVADTNRTNRLKMMNKAWPMYSVKHFKRIRRIVNADGTGNASPFAVTGSEYLDEIASSGFPQDMPRTIPHTNLHPRVNTFDFNPSLTIVTASFVGFGSSATTGVRAESFLTGAFKYPSYITGSHYNETADGGIPRIGSASWGFSLDPYRNETSRPLATTTDWQQGGDNYGIQRIDRVPFEAIVDPRLLKFNSIKDTGNGLEERFVMFDNEPHPSASLQPCSYAKFTTNDTIRRRYSFGYNQLNIGTHLTGTFLSPSAGTYCTLLFNPSAESEDLPRDDGADDPSTSLTIQVAGPIKQTFPSQIGMKFREDGKVVADTSKGANSAILVTNDPTLDAPSQNHTVRDVMEQLKDIIETAYGSKISVDIVDDRSFDVTVLDPKVRVLQMPLFQLASITIPPTTRDFGPKETFDDNNNLQHVFGQPVTSSALTSSLNLTSMKAIGETAYINAANNFYAESMNFFLEGGSSTVIASADTPQINVDDSTTYKMKIRLSRVNSGKDFPIYNLPQAFGPALDATFSPLKGHPGEGASSYNSALFSPDVVAHGYSGFTPPHYDKFSEVEYTFTPDENEDYSIGNAGAIETIIRRITIDNKTSPTIRYNRFIKATGSNNSSSPFHDQFGETAVENGVVISGFTNSYFNTSETVAVTSSFNKKSAMQLSASLKGLGLSDNSLVSVFRDDSTSQDVMRKELIIQSRWECPNISFLNTTPTKTSIPGISVPKGLWHQKGQDSEVAKLEILPPEDPNFGDLAQLLGMKFRSNGKDIRESSRTIGRTQDTKVISEAVVAIPFIPLANGDKQFFHFGPEAKRRIYQAVKMYPGHAKFKSSDTSLGTVEELLQDLRNGTNTTLQSLPTIGQEKFVDEMVASMIQHVIPPKMNFLRYSDQDSGKFVRPYLMYIFPFSHTLNKQDLQNIWQNLPPAIAKETYNRPGDGMEQSVTIKHSILGSPLQKFFNDGKMERVRWMIFKVKRAAEKNYFRKLDRDRLPSLHPDRQLEENEMFSCGFNWPYDYFSLVELVKIKADIAFTKFDRVPREGFEPLPRLTVGQVLGGASVLEANRRAALAAAARVER